MSTSIVRAAVKKRLEELRSEFWPTEPVWRGGRDEQGWFSLPRTLPLIIALLPTLVKQIKLKKGNPGGAYLDLFSRQREGIVEVRNEAEHAFASGYTGRRAVHTWREQMGTLEDLGLLKRKRLHDSPFGLVALVHPVVAIHRLRDRGVIPEAWWSTYRARATQVHERSLDDVVADFAFEPTTPPAE